MASTKPQTAPKPGYIDHVPSKLQRFLQQQNIELDSTDNQDAGAEGNGKPATSSSLETQKNPSAVTPTAGHGDARSPEGQRISQVNVPPMFQQGNVNSEQSKMQVLSERSSNIKNGNTKPVTKPASQPAVSPKPVMTNSKAADGTSQASSVAQSVIKRANEIKAGKDNQGVTPKLEQALGYNKTNKTITDSTCKETTSSSSSSLSTKEQCLSPSSENEKKDFLSQLRTTKNTFWNPMTEKNKKPGLTPVAPPVVPRLTEANESSSGHLSPIEHPGSTTSMPKVISKNNNNNKLIVRESDAKKFMKIVQDVNSVTQKAPPKPGLPKDINLAEIKQQYESVLANLNKNVSTEYSDEIYDDATSLSNDLIRQSSSQRKSERISLIPDMSADEEAGTPVYDEGYTQPPRRIPPPIPDHMPDDETYEDATSEQKVEHEEEEQLYEGEMPVSPSHGKFTKEQKKQQPDKADAKKKEEKEKKEKEEKKYLKEEKERAKKEKEEMKYRKKFKLTGNEKNVGEGILKEDVKDLKKGQKVTIVRLDQNPPNKWLIRTDTTMDYINSSIIEVDPNVIRQAMNSPKGITNKDNKNEPFYDDVANENPDEIYEVCP